MQTLKEIREMLAQRGLSPQKRFGQNFLIDHNLLAKVVELAGVTGAHTVLEVGPGTGTLTELLLDSGARVVACEIDRGLAQLLRDRLGGRENFTLIEGDVLAGKHRIAPEVLAAVGRQAMLVSNLPYNIATPLVLQCLLDSWQASFRAAADLCCFSRLTFTVQKEVAERLAAPVASPAYGPVSVIVALLGRIELGPVLPGTAFWPAPTVASQVARIDLDLARAAQVRDADLLGRLVALAFNQRRKQIGSMLKRKDVPFAGDLLAQAFAQAGVHLQDRPERISPEQFGRAANTLAGG